MRALDCMTMAVWRQIGPDDAAHVVPITALWHAGEVRWLRNGGYALNGLEEWTAPPGAFVVVLAGRRRDGATALGVTVHGESIGVRSRTFSDRAAGIPVFFTPDDEDPYVRALMGTFEGAA